MNLFRLAGDMTHLLSIIVLLLKIRTMKSCAGISLKTQELYIIVFLARYLDLFTRYISFYNTVMKLIFLGTSIAIVCRGGPVAGQGGHLTPLDFQGSGGILGKKNLRV